MKPDRRLPIILAAIIALLSAALLIAPASAGADFNIKLLDDTSTGATVSAINNIGDVLFVRRNWNTNRHEIYIQYGNCGSLHNIINDFYDNLPGFFIPSYTIENVTLNDRGQAAWIHVYSDGTQYHYFISYYDKGSIKIIVNNTLNQLSAIKVNNRGEVVWIDTTARKIYLYSNNTINQITDNCDLAGSSNGGSDPNLKLNNIGQIVWVQNNDNNIYIYDKSSGVRKIATNNPGLYSIYINDKGRVAWNSITDPHWGVGNIYICDINNSLIPTQITNSGNVTYLNLNNKGQIVCVGNNELNLYTDGQKQTITNNYSISWFGPRINDNGEIIWTSSPPEVYYWNNGKTYQIPRVTANDYFGNIGVAINNFSQIWFWQEISWGWGCDCISYLATPQVEVAKKVYGIFIGSRQVIPGKDYDLRADIAAERMAFKFASLPNYAVGGSILLKGDMAKDGIKKTDVQAAIDFLKPKLKAGDGLIFYVHGHGSSIYGDAFPGRYVAIGANIVSDDPLDNIEGLFNDILTDSALHDMLDGMDDIQKWVFIDACKSGGFYDSITSLKNACLITSADFFSDASAYDLDGLGVRGLFSYALEDGFTRGNNGNLKLDSKKPFGEVSFYEIVKYILDYNVAPWNDIIVCKLNLGDPVTFTSDMWKPNGFKTADFVGGFSTNRKDIAPILYLLLD